MERRRFLKAALGTAGTAIAWRYGGSIALGQIPWEESQKETTLLGDEHGLLEKHAFGSNRLYMAPDLAVDSSGRVHVVSISLEDGRERLLWNRFVDGEWAGEVPVSDGGSVLHPRIAVQRDTVAAVWVEQGDGDWSVRVAKLDGGEVQKVRTAATAEVALRPAVHADDRGRLWIVWEERHNGRYRIVARVLNDGDLSDPLEISQAPDRDCCRPAVCPSADGNVMIAWDQADAPGCHNIVIAECGPRNAGAPVHVTNHAALDDAPALARAADGAIWIGWHSNRKGTDQWDIPRWFRLCRYHNGSFTQPVSPPRDMNLEKEGTDQGFEFVRLLCAKDGRVIVTGRPSHNFCIQYYHGNAWSPLYRVPEDGWGGRGQHLNAAFAPNGDLWVIRRDLNVNILQRIEGLKAKDRAPVVEVMPREVFQPVSNVIDPPHAWEPLEELAGIEEPLATYYGDLHGHTWMSDGMGDVDQYFLVRRDYYGDDFASLTDHDTFVGRTIFPTEFEFQKEITDHFNVDGEFATLFGQEYTTGRYPRGLGHKCIYATDKRIPLFDHMTPEYDTSPKLNAAVRKWGGLVAPHHTGWTGTDWEHADDEIQTFAEIVSNHGRFEFMGNEPIKHRGGLRGHFLQDGFALGHRFGLIGGSDNHGLIWHHGVCRQRDSYRTGLACVLAPDLSRQSVFDALKKRRCFASTGNKPRLDFRVNGHLMGEEIEVSEGPITISAKVSARERLDYITVVKNNRDWYHFGGEGWESRFTIADDELPEKESFYYLRVLFKDGNMAWSSPVWVVRA